MRDARKSRLWLLFSQISQATGDSLQHEVSRAKTGKGRGRPSVTGVQRMVLALWQAPWEGPCSPFGPHSNSLRRHMRTMSLTVVKNCALGVIISERVSSSPLGSSWKEYGFTEMKITLKQHP